MPIHYNRFRIVVSEEKESDDGGLPDIFRAKLDYLILKIIIAWPTTYTIMIFPFRDTQGGGGQSCIKSVYIG